MNLRCAIFQLEKDIASSEHGACSLVTRCKSNHVQYPVFKLSDIIDTESSRLYERGCNECLNDRNSISLACVLARCKPQLRSPLHWNKVIKMSAAEQQQNWDTNHLADLLVTFCRLDDPLMWGARGLPRFDPAYTRWVLTAEDICFTNPIYSYFFRLGERPPNSRSLIFHWRVRGKKFPPQLCSGPSKNCTRYLCPLDGIFRFSQQCLESVLFQAPSAADCDPRWSLALHLSHAIDTNALDSLRWMRSVLR
jgi:hypothetical protein